MYRLLSWHCLFDFWIQIVLHYVVGKKQQSCWRVLWVPKGNEWACWKGSKPTAWHLMPLNKHLGKQGCNFWFRNHKIFNSCKNSLVNICPSVLFMFDCSSSASLFVASLLSVIFLLSFVTLPVVSYSHSFILLDHFKFPSVFNSVHSVSIDYLLFGYSMLFSVLTLEMYSRYFEPLNNNHLASQ